MEAGLQPFFTVSVYHVMNPASEKLLGSQRTSSSVALTFWEHLHPVLALDQSTKYKSWRVAEHRKEVGYLEEHRDSKRRDPMFLHRTSRYPRQTPPRPHSQLSTPSLSLVVRPLRGTGSGTHPQDFTIHWLFLTILLGHNSSVASALSALGER